MKTGIVKSVLSGDALILRGKPINGPPPEINVGLSNVTVPRLGSKGSPDEPGAWEAREFLRKLLIGKNVNFSQEAKGATGREYGVVTLTESVDGETNVAKILLKNGWAKCKDKAEESYYELEQQAKKNNLGLWNEANLKGRLLVEMEPKDLVQQYKGQLLPAIVEHVRDASTVRVMIQLSSSQTQTQMALSGIKTPVYRKDVPNMQDLIEPFSQEAKFFTESRLLNRDVQVFLEGLSGNMLVGSIVHPKGDIVEALLAEGLGQVNDFTLAMVTKDPSRLRKAEERAKEKKVRLWKTFVPKASKGEFAGTVQKVLNGESFIINTPSGERKIYLSSIRQIKPEGALPVQKGATLSGWPWEAKEFLRQRLVGKHVNVKIDYIKAPSEGFTEEREAATVTVNNVNIAEALVSKGLAQVIKHRHDDQDKASAYDALLLAEVKAKEGKKGGFGEKEPPAIRLTDVSESAAKAKQFLPFLQRQKQVEGVVEHVANASRFRVWVPKESCRLTFVLSGIRAPKVGRVGTTEKSEPFGPEGLKYSTEKVLQRDVLLEVTGVDKVGGFIGSLLLPHGKDTENVAVGLLEIGFAKVHDASARESSWYRTLLAAEKQAQDGKKGVWSLEQEEPVEQQVAEERHPQVAVSELIDGGHFWYQLIDSNNMQQLESLMEGLRVRSDELNSAAPHNAKVGEVVTAKFSGDSNWYRAKVRKVLPDGYEVLYIDYGNSEVVKKSAVRPGSGSQGLAKEAKLAFVKVPELDKEYGDLAYDKFRELTEGKDLGAIVVSKSGGVNHVVLFDPKKLKYTETTSLSDLLKKSINVEMARHGLALVDANINRKVEGERRERSEALRKGIVGGVKSGYEVLVDAVDEAKKGRLNLFRFGDVDDEDDY